MTLCPNCNKPFEVKAGKLFCKEHGWHTKNEAAEIVPAEEPTAGDIAAWKKALEDEKRSKRFADRGQKVVKDMFDESEDGIIDGDELMQKMIAADQAPIGLSLSDRSYYILIGVAGLTAIAILIHAAYRNRQQQKASGV